MTKIPDSAFRKLVDLIYRESGIVLFDKRELVEARLASLARKKKYKGSEEVIARLKSDETGEALIELLDKVSTNLTFFFRESAHFDFVSKVLMPELLSRKKDRREKRIRFWSSACSSGEEAYSLAMVVRDFIGQDDSWDVKILATDISTNMLKKAYEGRYAKKEVLKAPPTIIQRYFERKGDRHNPIYEVTPEIKKMVAFRRLNLLDESYPFSGLFDLIICRNVMIYFDIKTKDALLKRFYRYTEPGGYMFTGHAESLSSHEHLFKRVQVAIYRK